MKPTFEYRLIERGSKKWTLLWVLLPNHIYDQEDFEEKETFEESFRLALVKIKNRHLEK